MISHSLFLRHGLAAPSPTAPCAAPLNPAAPDTVAWVKCKSVGRRCRRGSAPESMTGLKQRLVKTGGRRQCTHGTKWLPQAESHLAIRSARTFRSTSDNCSDPRLKVSLVMIAASDQCRPRGLPSSRIALSLYEQRKTPSTLAGVLSEPIDVPRVCFHPMVVCS